MCEQGLSPQLRGWTNKAGTCFLHRVPDRNATDPPIPLLPLGELRGGRLSIRCGRCQRRVVLPIEQFAEHGPRLPLWRVVARLRCQNPTRGRSKCGGKPDLVTLVYGRERPKYFLVLREITVLDDRFRITD